MGKRRNQLWSTSPFDNDENESVGSSSSAVPELSSTSEKEETGEDSSNTLGMYLDQLEEERGSRREKALSFIIKDFRNNLRHEFAKKNFHALLCRYHNSIKQAYVSVKETSLASEALGLLALTIGYGDAANELFKQSLILLSKALKSAHAVSKITRILDCLAVITFIGGDDQEETRRVMEIIWEFINGIPPNVINVRKSPAIIKSATSAWLFLLTTLDSSSLNSQGWNEPVSHFSSALEEDNPCVQIAAGEALALLYEKECEGTPSRSNISDLKFKIVNRVKHLEEACRKGLAKKKMSSQENIFHNIYNYLQGFACQETCMKIRGYSLNTSTWSEAIQLKFLRRFLGGGFSKHLQENELLHNLFDLRRMQKKGSVKQEKLSACEKRMHKSPNSAVSKERTKSLKKERAISQRNVARFAANGDD